MSIHWGGRGAGHISRLSTSTTGVPALSLNFLSGTLDPRVTFTRNTTATVTGSNGLIQSSAINAPRFDYDPVTLGLKGLLIEEQRTNLLTYSNDATNVIWAKVNMSLTTGVADPAGGTSAITLTAGAALASVQQSPTVVSGVALSSSIWIKRRTGTGVINLRCGDATLIPVTVTSSWMRVSVTATPTTTTGRFAVIIATSGDEVDIYGAQLEAGSFATSYIPTVASQVTRSADVATMTGTNFSSWYNQTQGTFVVQADTAKPTALAITAVPVTISAGSTTNLHQIRFVSSNIDAICTTGGSTDFDAAGVAYTVEVPAKAAYAYKVDDFAFVANGGSPQTDTAGLLPVVDRMNIGTGPTNANSVNGHIQSIAYYNTRLANAQLQTLTT
jgi:hypothetical protein